MKKYYEIPLSAFVYPSLDAGRQATNGSLELEKQSLSLEPELTPRDEAALLLTVAAEVEHALMVQYLYGAYSINYDLDNNELKGKVRGMYRVMAQMAREEMGHLMTVQNLLQLIGAPFNFEREHSPFESELYPFRFKLEPLSKGSLAKYVTAERPAEQPENIPDNEWYQLEEIAKDAKCANDGCPVKHVGPIYERLIELFECKLQDKDFQTCITDTQATWQDWGYDEDLNGEDNKSLKVHVDSFEVSNPQTLRKQAVEALKIIAEQGEGYGNCINSHFERFLALYYKFCELDAQQFIWPVATNPSTLNNNPPTQENFNFVSRAKKAFEERGYISNSHSRDWGHLFNLRYRLLLAYLMHFLRTSGPRYIAEGPDKGDRTSRGLLLLWAFDEMRRIKKIAEKMVRLPLNDTNENINAGPPFQLPYTLTVSDNERSRWRGHLDVLEASFKLIKKINDDEDPFLKDLQQSDTNQIELLGILSCGKEIPSERLPKNFEKVQTILEEAVRGFSIDGHANFWTTMDRDEFICLQMFNRPFIARNQQDSCELTAEGSELVSRLNSESKVGRMPRYRPNIDVSRQEFISEWIDAQAPDNETSCPGRISEAEPNLKTETKTPFPAPKSVLSYEADIRPLFRDFDLETLQHFDGIDLNNLESVRDNIERLQERLQAGLLPYDACWPSKQIALFSRWVDEGMKN